MKQPTINTRLWTPEVPPDLDIQKKQAKAAQAQTLAAAYPAGGSVGGTGAAPSFDAYLAETSAYYTPTTIDYTPLDRETIQSLLQEALRPTYDAAINARKARTSVYNANLDADAWARGMGGSTYVTDVKSRNYRNEASDVSELEASYGTALAERLYDALQAQAKTQLEVDQFNAEQINEAKNRAYSAATALYNAALAATDTKSGSSGSTKKTSVSAALSVPNGTMADTLKSNLTSAPVYDKVATTTEPVILSVLQNLSSSERANLYNAKKKSDAKMLGEIVKSVGGARANELIKSYVSVK